MSDETEFIARGIEDWRTRPILDPRIDPFAGTFVLRGRRRRQVWPVPDLETGYQCVMIPTPAPIFFELAPYNEQFLRTLDCTRPASWDRPAPSRPDLSDGPFDRAWALKMIEDFKNPKRGR